MFLQWTFKIEGFVAFHAIPFQTLMNTLDMSLKIFIMTECFSTVLALKWFDILMDIFDMMIQSHLTRIIIFTQLTFERIFCHLLWLCWSFMYPYVRTQMLWTNQLLTNWARFLFSNRRHVRCLSRGDQLGELKSGTTNEIQSYPSA